MSTERDLDAKTKLLLMTNLFNLGDNLYPGRGFVIGRNDEGKMVQVYWIMGRSENSKNRVFSHKGGRIFTGPADPSKVTDPSLIIYNAMDENTDEKFFVVSNGSQTDAVVTESANQNLCNILHDLKYEPDSPNFTPRITGVCRLGEWPMFEIAILRKSNMRDLTDRFYFQYDDIENGTGRCITTYTGDDNPLPAFIGEPCLVPLSGSAKEIALIYSFQLNKDYLVSIAVKIIHEDKPSEVFIKNRFSKL